MKTEKNSSVPGKTEILIVEDSLTQATQLKHLLESNHYIVTVAQNGKLAIDWLSKHKPALVISDIMMPEMNGYELCKNIKFIKSTENIPVILLTRLSDPEEIIEGLSCGADSFITKPFNEVHLLSNITKFISDKNRTDQKKVPFGVQILYKGEKRFIQAEQQNVINLMISIYEGAILQNEKLIQTQEELRLLNEQLESIVEERTAELINEIELSNKITERLKKSEEKYHSIFDSVTDLYYETSLDGTIIEVSPSISIISQGQYSRDDLIGKPMSEFYSDQDQRQSLLIKLKEHGSVNDFEMMLKNRNGSLVPCSISSKISFDAQGKPEKIIGSMRNISERKRAEDIINLERKMLRILIDNIPILIYVKDIECRKIIANIADVRNIGCDREEEVLGKTDFDLYPGHIGERGYNDDKNVINSGKPMLDREEDFVDNQGVRHWIMTSKIPLQDKDGKITGLVGIGHDITERKRVEAELIKARDKAEESDRLKTAFLHNISHEIRTPMNAIMGFSGLLNDPDLKFNKRKDFITIIEQSCNQLLSIITDIVNIATIEAGIEKIVEKETNINVLCKQVSDQFTLKIRDEEISFKYKTTLPDNEAIINTDETKLMQILNNLLANALKFTTKGNINFGYELKGDFIEFYTSDSGIGIPKEMHEEIFKRFRQVENSFSRIYGGTGLGLSISKAYVELMGGKIWLISELNKGSVFYFTVPYKKVTVDKKLTRQPVQEKTPEFLSKKTVLIAEDEEFNFRFLEEILSGLNLEIIHAWNGLEAVEICSSNKKIDLVIMDLKMPVMNGYDAVKQIREFNPALPIIAQTAYSSEAEKEKALSNGCNDFITKPFSKHLIFSTIKEHVSSN